MRVAELLFGPPLASHEAEHEQIGAVSGIPVLGLDALASTAYGPEAALTVLIPAGAMAGAYMAPITFAILLVLVLLYVSYRQTIAAYPDGGGSYTVAKENLGPGAGLLAASALSTDYILNVAVAISAGAGAIVSVVPPLLPYTLPLCLGMLALLTIVNLRGIRTAGLAFRAPTFAFIGCLGAAIAIGVVKTLSGDTQPLSDVQTSLPATTSTVGVWLVLRAFASGCTAMTGVEATSNATPLFREPRVVLAQRTLGIIVVALAVLLVGVTWLAGAYHIVATAPGQPGYESILSQIVAAVAGRGLFYQVTMAAVLAVLALSANTSFADFPRVCRLLALDGFLPPTFAHRGRRLVFTDGILMLTALSAILLVVFHGVTDRLIPLFAVGAFLAFTLSQLGMVVHWHRRPGDRGARHARVLNAVGAVASAAALGIILVSKFIDGAWLTIIVVPAFVAIFLAIRRYQERVASATLAAGPVDLSDLVSPMVVVPLDRLDHVSRKALRFALTISREVYAVQVVAEELDTDDVAGLWPAGVAEAAAAQNCAMPELVVLRSPYRDFFGPFLTWIQELASQHRDRPIAVIIPELAHRRWYHFLLSRRATLLKTLLIVHGGPQIVIINTLWYLDRTADRRRPS